MTGIIAVAGLVIFTVLVSAWNHREGRKWKRARVLSSFGQKPEEGERPSEQTRILWEKTKTENGLDDITWSAGPGRCLCQGQHLLLLGGGAGPLQEHEGYGRRA